MIEHKHIIIRAEVREPPKDVELTKKWLTDLISKIGMNLLLGPIGVYLDKEGNRGMTCVAIIETSHIALHVWDETFPALIQLDVYTCGPLDPALVFDHMQQFEPVKLEYLHLDRETRIFHKGQGTVE